MKFPDIRKRPVQIKIGFIVVFGVAGLIALLISHAATPNSNTEVEDGTLGSCAAKVTDTTASSQSAVRFTSCSQGSTPGANLPISYVLSTLSGTARYVATTGSDTTGTGTVSAPYATVAKAYTVAVAGDSIVVRGGTYREGGLSFTSAKPVTFTAYPGETPIFNGAQAVANNTGWTVSGTTSYHAYTPIPVENGSGIDFINNQNLNSASGYVGKFADQAWQGSTQLQQVAAVGSVAAGKFFVDTTNSRIYLATADVTKGSLEVSSKRIFLTVAAPGVTIQGLKITRFSNDGADYGVINIKPTADNSTLVNDEISESAYITVSYQGNTDTNKNSTMKNVTVTTSNWMGVSATGTDNLTLDAVKITSLNQFNEFTFSPQSGAIKTSRTQYTTLKNSLIDDNNSHGAWFDQSNYHVEVANNTFTQNAGSSLFFEISDGLYMVNNYVDSSAGGSSRAVKLSASSGLYLVNNTIIGGADPVGVYVDSRSIAGCSNPANALCTGSYSSDRDSFRAFTPTMTWIPGIDLFVDNIIAYPSATGYCGSSTALCITLSNLTANVALESILHHADATLSRPQTVMNGNVYANGTGSIIVTGSTTYATPALFNAAMAKTPVLITGLEANSLYGNSYVSTDGTPTTTLTNLHSSAVPVPTNATINKYLNAGTKHYGVTNK